MGKCNFQELQALARLFYVFIVKAPPGFGHRLQLVQVCSAGEGGVQAAPGLREGGVQAAVRAA